MYRFYVDKSAVAYPDIVLSKEDYNHICNVLRMRPGGEITVCDGAGTDYHCRLTKLSRESVTAEILGESASGTELPVRLVLFQGMPKKDKMEFIIQKAVELGAAEIVPVMTKRTVVKLEDEKKEAKKIERWRAVARAAAMQSMRGVIPGVSPVVRFSEALKAAGELDALLLPYEHAQGIAKTKRVLSQLAADHVRSVGIWIGPEGGFEEEEVRQAQAAGAVCVTLGHRILRTETAGMAMLSLCMFAFERD